MYYYFIKKINYWKEFEEKCNIENGDQTKAKSSSYLAEEEEEEEE